MTPQVFKLAPASPYTYVKWAIGAFFVSLGVRIAYGSRHLLPKAHPARVILDERNEKAQLVAASVFVSLPTWAIVTARVIVYGVALLVVYELAFGLPEIPEYLGMQTDPVFHQEYPKHWSK